MRKHIIAMMTAGVVTGVTGTALQNAPAHAISAAQWFVQDDAVVLTATIEEPLAAGDVVTLTFPPQTDIADTSTFVTITGQAHPRRSNSPRDHAITLTLDRALPPGALRIMVDEVFAHAAVPPAAYAIAITVTNTHGAPRLYGAAMPRHGTTSTVTASVGLAATIGVSTEIVPLGMLSPYGVAQARQTYYVHANNDGGVRVQFHADGPLRTAHGDTIAAVRDGAVTAGHEEYGIALENARGVTIAEAFRGRDSAVPLVSTDIATADAPVGNGSFDVVYKASIDADTPAGTYHQTSFFTVVPNI